MKHKGLIIFAACLISLAIILGIYFYAKKHAASLSAAAALPPATPLVAVPAPAALPGGLNVAPLTAGATAAAQPTQQSLNPVTPPVIVVPIATVAAQTAVSAAPPTNPYTNSAPAAMWLILQPGGITSANLSALNNKFGTAFTMATAADILPVSINGIVNPQMILENQIATQAAIGGTAVGNLAKNTFNWALQTDPTLPKSGSIAVLFAGQAKGSPRSIAAGILTIWENAYSLRPGQSSTTALGVLNSVNNTSYTQ